MRYGQGERGWFRLLILAAVFAMVAFVVACGDDEKDADPTTTTAGETPAAAGSPTAEASTGKVITVNKGETLKIGISTTLTTDNAELGLPIRAAAEYAISQKGTIQGFELEAIAEDDGCAGPASTTAAEALISKGVVAVLGPMCSGGAVAAFDAYDDAGILVMSGSTTGVAVTEQGADYFFRTAWNDATQGGEMAKYVFETLGLKKAVLVDDQSVYGKGLMDVFDAAFKELGGEVAGREAVTVGEADFSAIVTKIETAAPEIVVFGGFIAEGSVLVKQLSDAGVTAAFMGADGIADQDWIDQSQGAAADAYVSRGPVPAESTLYDAFAAAFETDTGAAPGQFGEHYYDAANIMLAAIEKVATVDADGNLIIDVDELIAEIAATNYAGASGQIQFNDVGDRIVAPGVVNRIDQVKNNALERIQ
jgi:branched-chain amino acid transport system substrate-binding protein